MPTITDSPPILIAGYGDLGSAVGASLAQEGLPVLGLSRSERTQTEGVRRLVADVTQAATLAVLAQTDPQILLYCVAASEQSDDNYRAHYVDGLRNVLAALGHARNLRHVFFVSSTRVYGQVDDTPLSETSPAQPADFGGRRLLEAEQVLDGLTCQHTALRLSGIYGPGRERMLRLALDPASWPQQNAWSNRIHRDDAAAFIVHLMHAVLSGKQIDDCYLVTDSCPAPQIEVLHHLAGYAPGTIEVPAPAGGKRLSNARMLGTGFRLRYPDYRTGYASLMEQAPP